MRPEDVPADLVEKAARHRAARQFSRYPEITWESLPENVQERYLWSAADYLTAVLPEIQARALDSAAVRARDNWAPDPCPWVGFLDDEAARLRATA